MTARATPRGRAMHLIDVLADLHAVDVDAVGLGDLARRDGLHRAPAEALVDAVGGLEDPRAAGHRRGRSGGCASACPSSRARRSPTATTGSGTASSTRDRPDQRGARLGAVHPRRPAGRRRLPRRLLDRPGAAAAPRQRPDAGRRVPDLRRAARALRHGAPAATCRASTTTSPSGRGGWRSSARASTPATCTA